MQIVLISLIFIQSSDSRNPFDETADAMFETVIGGIDDTFAKIDTPQGFDRIRELEDTMADPENVRAIIREQRERTEAPVPRVTIPEDLGSMTIEDMKIRMRKLYLTKLVEEDRTPMPDFSEDSDGTEHLTRRFKQIVRSRTGWSRRTDVKHSTPKDFYYDEFEGMSDHQKYIKNITLPLMEQFIYSTQYKLPYLLMLRGKYSSFLKYKIGYCFALLRLLQQQQRIIYTTLDRWYNHFNNLMIHMKLYEKVVRLDVDIRDLCAFIRLMNYKQKILDKPDYYVDLDVEEFIAESVESNHTVNLTTPSTSGAG